MFSKQDELKMIQSSILQPKQHKQEKTNELLQELWIVDFAQNYLLAQFFRAGLNIRVGAHSYALHNLQGSRLVNTRQMNEWIFNDGNISSDSMAVNVQNAHITHMQHNIIY